MQAKLEEIINLSLKKALDYDARGNVGQAYAYYNAVLELCPPKRSELEKRFTTILCEWGINLEQKNRIKDVVKCYKNALELYPKNAAMLNNFAAHLLRNEESLEAISYLQKALEVDPNYLPAERNLQNAYSMSVDRWHFCMLNDQSRNKAFEKAIKKRIQLGYDTVLDIGTGTGLLSLFASDAGAKKIYACEYSPVMCKIAKKVFHKNGAENVNLICKPSTDLKVPEDLNERVKLIVTEIFDAALFGELVIPTLIDAHKNLLATDGSGIIIPMNATLYIAAVECEYMRFRSSVMFNKCSVGSLNLENIIILPDEQYYDTENLENVDLNYVTEPKPLLNINFNDLEELQNFMEDGMKERLTTVCRYDGTVDGLVAWFKLNLDESITLDSSQGKSCWQLAVFPTYPLQVKSNEKIVVTAEILNGRLKCSYQLEDAFMHEKSVFQLPRDVITFFNDKEYLSTLIEAAKSNKQEFIKSVLDTSPFPLYGLSILKERADCKVLYFKTENPALIHLIEHVANANNIQGKVIFFADFREIDCSLDNIYVHNFDTKGELIDWGQQSFREIYSCLLSSSGTLLPEKVFLIAQLIYSEELPKMVSVDDNNLHGKPNSNLFKNEEINEISDNEDDSDCDNFASNENIFCSLNQSKYKIAEYINKFKIDQIFDLNSSLYNCTILSEPKILTEIYESEVSEKIINFKIINAGNNKVPPNALICWYKVFITDNLAIETKRNKSFMNHTAVVFDSKYTSKSLEEKSVNIKVKQMCDLVKISIV